MNRDRSEEHWKYASKPGWRLMPKKQIRWLLSVLLAGSALGVHAQTVWTYEVIGADNNAKVTFHAPMDISYPPANVRMPIYNANEKQGVLLTAQEEAARRRKPTLIILLGSGIR
jgi:hypothetical protein